MSFKKIRKRRRDIAPDFDYLRNIGYVDLFGNPLKDTAKDYYKDEERNAYIISLGLKNPNIYEGETDQVFVLCVNGKPVGLRTESDIAGSYLDNNFEKHWKVKQIKYPENWENDIKIDMKQLIIDALTAMTLYITDRPEGVRKVEFEFIDDNFR